MWSQRYLPRIREESSLSTEISHATANSGEFLSSRCLWAKRAAQEYPTNWTDERVALLKKLWVAGVSASLIAEKLGEVTRNAVVGKVHRLGLTCRLTRDRIPNPTRFRAGHSAIPSAPKAAFVKPKPRAAPTIQLSDGILPQPPLMKPTEALQAGDCRFPIGDPQDPGFGFCGHPRERGAFCAAHGALVYRSAVLKTRRAA